MHPYPRKLATPRKEISIPRKEISIPEKRMKSNSLKSLDFDQENQSPKSVLSAVGSESLGSSDSDTPNGSLSPVSSISRVHTSGFTLAESRTPCEEASLNADSVHDEKTLMVRPGPSSFYFLQYQSLELLEKTIYDTPLLDFSEIRKFFCERRRSRRIIQSNSQTFWDNSICN